MWVIAGLAGRLVGWSVGPSVGRSVGRAVGPLQILRRELLLQFWSNFNETYGKWWYWGIDVQDVFFVFVGQSVAMVTTILPKSCGSNNFHTIQAIKVKFSIYDDVEV